MGRSRESDPIAYDIGPVRLHRTDVSGVYLGATSTIDQPETGNGAALIIGAQNYPPEDAIANDTRCGKDDTTAFLVEEEGRLLLLEFSHGLRLSDSGKQWKIFIKTEPDDALEILGRQGAHCGLSTPRDFSAIIQKPALDESIRILKGNRICEVQITTRFDQSQVHTRG